MYRKLRPLLFLLPPEVAHSIALSSLKMFPAAAVAPDPVRVMGLEFPNRVGLAAGFDKTGAHADALAKLGFGFVETGTFTPRAQKGNPKPRLFRLRREESLLNRMGFNNPGAEKAASNLRTQRRKGYLLGVNVGKGKDTPLEKASEDYVRCLEVLHAIGDYFTVNVSSPNTSGLRDLEEEGRLGTLLGEFVAARDRLGQDTERKPIVVKLSPDIRDVSSVCSAISASGVGVIVANTRLHTPGSPDANPAVPPDLPRGGLSGKTIAESSLKVLEAVRDRLPPECALIACGGISGPQDVRRRLDAGADLVQLYTGLVYQGPALVTDIVSAMRADERG